MYPDLPYPGFTWTMNHHWGVAKPETLYRLLQAANLHAAYPDASASINSYIIANNLLTSNIRADSGQPDAWRDYQQMLSDLGLIFSTTYLPNITPTPLGLAYLDGAIGFSEVMTLQALRYQYPNGHKKNISTSLRQELKNSPFANVQSLTRLQFMTGVKIRPGVLIWRVLDRLQQEGEDPLLTYTEIQTYLMRCSTHQDTEACIADIIRVRRNALNTSPLVPVGDRRDSQEWGRFLCYTPLFTKNQNGIMQSSYGVTYRNEINAICESLEMDTSFWTPRTFNKSEIIDWYARFGELDLSIGLAPEIVNQDDQEALNQEFVVGREIDPDEVLQAGALRSSINLRDFNPATLRVTENQDRLPIPSGTTIESSYDAALADNAHRTHDLMVLLIANICRAKGAVVMNDPKSVDLLVEYNQEEFIIEVKSVTPRNFVGQLRYAIGQVLQYDYLRSNQSQLPRRKVIALAAQVPDNLWCVPFLNHHLDMDLLSLQGRDLKVTSPSALANQLFYSF